MTLLVQNAKFTSAKIVKLKCTKAKHAKSLKLATKKNMTLSQRWNKTLKWYNALNVKLES